MSCLFFSISGPATTLDDFTSNLMAFPSLWFPFPQRTQDQCSPLSLKTLPFLKSFSAFQPTGVMSVGVATHCLRRRSWRREGCRTVTEHGPGGHPGSLREEA